MLPALTLAIALLAPPPGQLAQARLLYETGGQAYRAGKYAVAIDAFESARRITEKPIVVFALAQAYRLRFFQDGKPADLEAAVAAYRRYLTFDGGGRRRIHATQHLSMLAPYLERMRLDGQEAAKKTKRARLIVTSSVAGAMASVGEGPEQPVPATFDVEPGPHQVAVRAPKHQVVRRETVAVAGTAVATMLLPTPEPAYLEIAAPPGAKVLIDDAVVGRSPLTSPVKVAPGTHQVLVRASGRIPVARTLTVGPAQTVGLDVDLERTGQRTLAWGVLGGAGATATAAIITGALAFNAQSDAEAIETRLGKGLTGSEFAEHARLEADRDSYANATIALGVVATSALIAGLVLYVFDEPSVPARSTTPAVMPSAMGWQ